MARDTSASLGCPITPVMVDVPLVISEWSLFFAFLTCPIHHKQAEPLNHHLTQNVDTEALTSLRGK